MSRRKINLIQIQLVIIAIASLSIHPSYGQIRLPVDPIELPLRQLSEKLQQKEWHSAKQINTQLHQEYPNLKLSALISKFIEKQLAPPLTQAILLSPEQDEFSRENLLAELSLRNQYIQPFDGPNISQNLILTLASHIKHAILIDVQASRLYLVENQAGQLQPIADYYIGIGKQGIHKTIRGDHRTPVGIYTIIEYIPDQKLPELYGIGAFPIDYPNTWDQRLGHTGSGIWLHGVPRATYSRGPRSSRGCVTISNDLFTNIRPYIQLKQTPLIISKKVEWSDSKIQNKVESEVQIALHEWKKSWQSLNTEAYLDHYHSDYRYQHGDLAHWSSYKRRVNSYKKFIDVEIKNLSIFNYPLQENLVLVRYTQHYQSDSFNSVREKEQYWKKENARWQIIAEHVL